MEKIRLWLQSLSQQQRILFLALFASVAYFIWSSLWGGYYTPERAAVSAQKKVLDDKIKDIDATTMRLKALRTDPDILATKKKLDDLREQLKKVSRQLVSSKQMLDQLNGVFTKDPVQRLVLNHQGKNPIKNQTQQLQRQSHRLRFMRILF
jgi:cell division protein FtsB